MTKKTGRHISLYTKISVSDVLQKFRNLKTKILNVKSSGEILILKCPAYSIEHYNKYHRHPHSESFHEDDIILQDKIRDLNDKIIDLNPNFARPNFSLDLMRNTTVNKGRRSKYNFMFKDLYNDRIHPCPILSTVWLRKIQKIVCKCFFCLRFQVNEIWLARPIIKELESVCYQLFVRYLKCLRVNED